MQCLTSSSTSSLLARPRQRAVSRTRSRTVSVIVRSSIIDDAFKGFISIFSPPQPDTVPRGGEQSFDGRTRAHGPGRPFKDQYTAKSPQGGGTITQGATFEAPPAPAAATAERKAEKGPAGYVAEAVERVVAHNFTGDKETEPDWEHSGSGWNKDTRTRDSDGFHAKKL